MASPTSNSIKQLAVQHWLWLMPVLLFVSFFLYLGIPPLFDLDEGAFSSATWEMLLRQDFITVYSNGDLRFDKPILIYWLQALSVQAFGISEFAFRLPSAFAATIWAMLVYGFVREHHTQDRTWLAIIATLLLINSFMVVIIGRAATADAVLNTLIVLSLFDIYRYFQHDNPPSNLVYRVYLWIGLGILCKGPIAIFVPFLASLIYALWDGKFQHWLKAIINPIGWVVMLIVAAPWYILEYMAQGQLFIDGFFLKHNVGRFSDTMENHGGSIFYYIPVLLLIIMPFGGWLLQLLWHIKHSLNNSLDRFLWTWFLVVFVFFSFSNTQLPHYLLYGTTPLLILLARHHQRFRWVSLSFMPVVLFAIAWLLLPEIFSNTATNSPDDRYIQAVFTHANETFGGHYRIASGLFLVIIVSLMTLAMLRKLDKTQAMLIAGIAQTLFLATTLLPTYAQIQQQPVKEAGLYAKQNLSNERIVMWKLNMPSFVIYREQIAPKHEPQIGDVVYTRIDKLEELDNHELLYSKGGIVLARKR